MLRTSSAVCLSGACSGWNFNNKKNDFLKFSHVFVCLPFPFIFRRRDCSVLYDECHVLFNTKVYYRCCYYYYTAAADVP